MKVELTIENKGVVYKPSVLEGITWETERQGAPSTLRFDVVKAGDLDITEGNVVKLVVDDVNVFFGFIFSKSRNKDKIISIVAYDQLRYFKNKDTYLFENKTAGGIVKAIVDDFKLQYGLIENTNHWIASLVKPDTTLFDIVQSAIDETVMANLQLYVLYDDFGKITFRNAGNWLVDYVVCDRTAVDFDYSTSIDSSTYNKVKIFYNDEPKQEKNTFELHDIKNINKWGILQLTETAQKGKNPKIIAENLLALHNRKTRNLSISNCIGDLKVRAGCSIFVELSVGDLELSSIMLVEKCKHVFKEDEHYMDLTVRGGEFSA